MAETTAERIARVLGERIVTGELPPGTPLRQDHVAAEFTASHVPAREAFQMLKARGLAVREPRRGMRVAPLDPATIQETVEIRAALETLALAQAAPRLNAAAFERIEAALAEGDRAQTIVEWEAANRAFHAAVVAPCRMPRLLQMLDELQLANSRIIFATNRGPGWRPGSGQAHRQIVTALRQKDAERAVTLLRRHIRGLERGLPADEPGG